ncbi:MAG: SCP-like extracellular [Novosphingobium sp.]|nr:MAG: SCP-like extracellular [Novosphingobium sp.]
MKRLLNALVLAAAGAALTATLVPSTVAAGEAADYAPRYAGYASRYSAPPSGDFASRVLNTHNGERSRMGLRPLRWNARLSAQAQQWASSLARRGAFEHSNGDDGENLWMGTANGYSPEQMVASFLSERRAFRAGRFPNVSRTGNWADVGHYTQIIWPETQEVGCAVVRGGRDEVMVCRYWPAGNVYGESVG